MSWKMQNFQMAAPPLPTKTDYFSVLSDCKFNKAEPDWQQFVTVNATWMLQVLNLAFTYVYHCFHFKNSQLH